MEEDPLTLERARLADQLRSTLLDPLALLAAQATVFEQAADPDDRRRAAFAMLAALARQALQRARDLEADLDDRRLDQIGLEAGLDLLAGRVMRAAPLLVDLSLPRRRADLPHAVARALWQFAQAALARAAGPAAARRVRLRLTCDADHVALCVADDGAQTDDPDLTQRTAGLIARCGGALSSAPSAHGGLSLCATIPLRPVARLTPREREVLSLLAAGLSTRAIAERLGLAPRTVTFHLANIYAKLGVAGRAEALIAWLRGGPGAGTLS